MRKLFLAVLLGVFSVSANAVVVDYTTVADGNYASVSLGGTTVTGSNSVTSGIFAGFRGLGILGNGSLGNGDDASLDVGETMSIDFGAVVGSASLTLVDVDPPGNVTFEFEAFDGLTSLGTFAFPAASTAPDTFDLFALSGVSQMTSFTVAVLSPSAPIGLQIQSVTFDDISAIPVPAAAWLFATGVLGLIGIGRRKQRQAA